MHSFLSRIRNTVASVGRDGAGGGDVSVKGGNGKSPRAGGRSEGSRATARTAAGQRSGARSVTKADRRPAARSKPAPTAKSRAATGAGKRGGARTGATKKRTAEGEPPPAEETADTRGGLSPFVRALAVVGALGAMVAFAGALSRLTLEPSAASEAIAHTNLEPGASIRAYLSQPAFQDTVKQLGGNVLLGAPFGVLLPVLLPRARGFVRVTLVTAVAMLFVELVQGALITGRAFDVDDVLLNSTGALLGYLFLGRRLGRAVHPTRRPWWRRWVRGSAAR